MDYEIMNATKTTLFALRHNDAPQGQWSGDYIVLASDLDAAKRIMNSVSRDDDAWDESGFDPESFEVDGHHLQKHGWAEAVVSHEITDDQIKILCRITTRDEAGIHFTIKYEESDLDVLEEAGLIEVYKPIHEPSNIPYSQEYWQVTVTEAGRELVDAHPELQVEIL
jgi:hypothetical protein